MKTQSTKLNSTKFLGCLTENQTQIVYSTTILSIAIFTLSNLPKSSYLQDGYEEEEEDLINSRDLILMLISISKLLAKIALFSSLLSLIGTVTSRSILHYPLKLQALINLFITSFSSIVLGTLYISPTLLNSASHQLCLIAIPTEPSSNILTTRSGVGLGGGISSSSSSSSSSEYSIVSMILSMSQTINSLWNNNVVPWGENCDERASSIILPCIILLSISTLIHLHLVHVLFSFDLRLNHDNPAPLLPIHRPTATSSPFLLIKSSTLPTPPVLHQPEKPFIFL